MKEGRMQDSTSNRSSARARLMRRAARTLQVATGAMAMVLLVGALAPGGVAAQEVDVTGTWNMTVESQQGTSNPTVTLEQDGQDLTGHYSSQTLGEADVTGTVNGSQVTFSFTAEVGGQSVPVSYTATLEGDVLSGELNLAGQQAGTFTAERAEG